MMSKAFVVCGVSSDEDAKTNHVYLNPIDHESEIGEHEFVLIESYPFTVRPNKKVSRGFIAFNAIQRRLLKLSVTGRSTVTIQHAPRGQPDIAKITMRVEYIAASKSNRTLDCKEFSDLCKARFMSQCFRQGQELAVVGDAGMKLLATVASIEFDSLHAKSQMGYLTELTTIIVIASEGSRIVLTNVSDGQLDAQQHHIIENLNLESLGIGGLKSEFAQVFRRAFVSRIFPPSYIKKLGIKHVKGVLLYGPPGTGKTLIARKIGEILKCHEPKIVNGPEVFNKYVGGTEENVRNLFADAEAEQAAKGDQSQLHLIIFDEFDAICKQRGATRDSTGVSDNVVNQLLSKIDGVNSLNNVLLIGITNRKDLIDEAILRPGRFEVHVEIGLPDEQGRAEIFRIHTRGMSENRIMSSDVNISELVSLTKNYSGAEIEGVVRASMSNAFNRHINLENIDRNIDTKNVFVTRQDFLSGVEEVKPAFGQAEEECANLQRGGIIDYGELWNIVEDRCSRYVGQLNDDGKRIHSLSVLINGAVGSGKSAVAAYLSQLAGFPYTKVISSGDMVGYGEMQRVNIIRRTFEDAYKSPASCIILDDLERLIDFSNLGGRYSNALLQAFLVLIKRLPEEGKKLMVIATTAQYEIVQSLELASCFSVKLQLPLVPPPSITKITQALGINFNTPEDEEQILQNFPCALPIKQLLLIMEMAAHKRDMNSSYITYQSMQEALESTGIN